MAEFRIDDGTTDDSLFAEAPDDVDEMKIYIDGGHTVYLKTEDRRRLIDFLIRHTEDVIV